VAQELRLGTRGSQLALWQANTVAARIAATGGPACRVVVIKTSGDRLQEAPLSDIGGKRLFVKEIEDALLRHDVDLAVHSSKDMPAALPDGLAIAGVLPREDPLDAIVLPVRLKPDTTTLKPDTTTAKPDTTTLKPDTTTGKPDTTTAKPDTTTDGEGATGVASGFSRTLASIEDLVAVLGQSPSIGTGSVRRIAQLARIFPGARFVPIRGNLDTRLRKLDEGAHDALVLAAAGLRRLGFGSRISFALPAGACVPAPGQGIVAIEMREGDDVVRCAVARINDPAAGAALAAERALVEALGGGCQTPIGALASPIDGDRLELVAIVVALDGSRAVHARASGLRSEAGALGARVATELLARGAGDILDDARRSPAVSIKSTALTDD
jgi:hydroxymethylbilane synthase